MAISIVFVFGKFFDLKKSARATFAWIKLYSLQDVLETELACFAAFCVSYVYQPHKSTNSIFLVPAFSESSQSNADETKWLH